MMHVMIMICLNHKDLGGKKEYIIIIVIIINYIIIFSNLSLLG